MPSRRPQAVIAVALLALALVPPVFAAEPPGLEEARAALERGASAQRMSAIARLAEAGTMADAQALLALLRDADAEVRTAATAALWQVWSRSGDPAIDALLARGIAQAEARELDAALATFDEVVARRPEFAEGWNKRATLRFLMGDHEGSLKDCDEVLQRNPTHFGALSGAGQNHLLLGRPEQALHAFQRALEVNPNLAGAAASVRALEQHLRERARRTI